MSQDDNIKKAIITLFMVAIGFIFAILLIVSYSGVLVNKDATCGFNYYTNVTRPSYSLSDYVLNQPYEEVVQNFRVEDANNLKYEFCFGANSTGSGATLEIVNFNVTLTRVYVDSSKTSYCALLNAADIQKNNYLGVSCADCSDNNNVTIYKQSLGDKVQIINKMGVKANACEWFTNATDVHNSYSNNFTGDNNHHWQPPGANPNYNPSDLNSPATVFLFHYNMTSNRVYHCETDSNESIITVSQGETLQYKLVGYKDCKGYVSFFSKWLYISLGIIALLLLLYVGFSNIRERIMEGW